MKLLKQVKKLCTPAYLYLVLSIVGLIMMMIQNAGNTNIYCVGNYECQVPNTFAVFAAKSMYVAFWTFILHALCKAGYKNVSWLIVLIPFAMLAIMIGIMMIRGSVVNVDGLTIEGLELLEKNQWMRTWRKHLELHRRHDKMHYEMLRETEREEIDELSEMLPYEGNLLSKQPIDLGAEFEEQEDEAQED